MATLSGLQNALPLRALEPGNLSTDMPPEHLAALLQDPGQIMQEPGQQMVTNLALSQGWSFAAVTADAESPESASSGTAQALPQQDGDAVVLEKHQEPDPEVLVPDTVGSEASKTESPAQGSAATDTTAETPSSKDTRTLPSGNETSEDDGGDMIAAIRKSKNKGLRISQPAAQPASSVPPGVPAANTPLDPVENVPQELPSFNDSANNGTKDTSVPWLPGTIGSSFLAQYNYTGNKPQDPKATKKSEAAPKSRKKEADDTAPKHSRKRPTPEIIDLTGAPEEPDNPPARREGKRRKLDENGREKKRHKSQRAESQAYDDARKEQKRSSSEKRKVNDLFGDKSVTRSSISRKSKESSRHKRRQERREAREREKEKARQGSVLGVQPVPGQRLPVASSQNLAREPLQSVQQGGDRRTLPETHPQPRQELFPEPLRESDQHPRQALLQLCQKYPHLLQEIPQLGLEPRQPPRPVSPLGQESLQYTLSGSTQVHRRDLAQDLTFESRPEPRPQQGRNQGSPQGRLTQPNRRKGVNHDGVTEARRKNAEIINAKKNRLFTVGDKTRTGLEETTGQTAQPSGGFLSAADLQDDVGFFNSLMNKVPEKRTAQIVSSVPNGHSEPNGFPATSRRAEPPSLSQPVNRLPGPPPATAARNEPLPYVHPGPATGRSRQTSQLAQSRNIFQPKPRSQSRYNPQPRTDIPQNQTIIPPPPPAFPRASLDNPQPQPSTYVPLPLRRAQQQQQQNRTLPPPYHEDLLPQPPPQPRETTSALEALGPDRTVIQYVVYRTPRFTPPTSTTTGTGRRSQNGDEDEDEDDGERLLQQLKHSKAIRCSEYLSLPAANSQAAGLQERPRKGVVGKGWGMAASVFSSSTASASASASRAVGGGGVGGGEGEGSNPNLNSESAAAAQGAAPSSGSAAGAGAGSAQSPAVQLYEGKVTYANGEVQYFWVGEETRDLGGPVAGVAPRDMGKAGGFCGVRVDKAGVAIYTRKRFDVWSRVWVGREVRERPRGSGGQRVVFECGGEGGGEDGGEVEGEGGGAKGGVEAEVLVENLDEENKERTGGEEANGVDESGGDGEKGEYNGKGNADNSEIGKLVSNGERNEESNGDGNRDDIGPGTDEGSGREDKNETAADEVTTTSNPRPEPSESQKELPAEEDKEEDDETDDERDTDDADNTRARRSPSVSSTATLAFPPRTSPLDLITITSKLHGTYTTRLQANRAALSTFFDLAKPKNSAMEDNHYYRYELKPEATAQFEEGGYGQQDCATGVLIEWDPPGERPYRWEFLRVQVEVVESELKGPVDIGDMVVEGGEGGDVDGGGLCDEANGEGEERGGNGEVVSGKQAVALPGSVEESEGEVSEEE